MLVYPPAIDPSNAHLRYLARQLAMHRREIGSRWRRLTAGRQALLVLAHLRCGDTHAQLAAGFGIGIATVFRCIREAIEVLAALPPSLTDAVQTASRLAFVILDGTLLPIDRIAADTPVPLSRHGARCRCCHRSVSPCRSPNPACGSHRTGLSTVSVVQAWLRGQGLGIVLPR